MRPDPCHQDSEAEGFADAVVCTGFERHHDLLVGRTTAQHDDGMMEPTGSESLDHVLAVLVRQVEIHDHEIWPLPAEGVLDLASAGHRGGPKLGVAGNLFRKRRPKIVVVVDDQDVARMSHGRVFPTSSLADGHPAPDGSRSDTRARCAKKRSGASFAEPEGRRAIRSSSAPA